MKNHYQLLGVARDADIETIKAAHRREVREHHPDMRAGDKTSERRSQLINAAYDVLKDPGQRLRYDNELLANSRRFRYLVLTGVISATIVSSASLFMLSRIGDRVGEPPVAQERPPEASQVAAASEPHEAHDAVSATPQATVPEPSSPSPAIAESSDSAPAIPDASPVPGSLATRLAPLDFVRDTGDTDPVEVAAGERPRLCLVNQALLPNLLLAWQRIEKSANTFDMLVFSEAYAGTPAGTLAEQKLGRLIDASDNIPDLISLGSKAEGKLAERIRDRLAVLVPARPRPAEEQETDIADANEATGDPSLDHAVPAIAFQTPDRSPLDGAVSPLGARPSLITAPKEISLPDLVQVSAEDSASYVRRAASWAHMGDLDRALADYDSAIRIDDENTAAYRGRGMIWRQRGHIDRALADLDRAVRLGFSDPEIYRERGMVWFERGRYDRAIADFNQAIKLAPDNAKAYLHRGEALLHKGDFRTAIADFDRVIRLAPDMTEAHRGRDLALTERREEASVDGPLMP